MRRRDFIALAAVTAAWPLTARSEPKLPVVGFLSPLSPEGNTGTVAAFNKGLSQAGFTEGRDVAIEYRWARNDIGQLPKLATELVHLPASVIAATGGLTTALAAKNATSTIPVVFNNGNDPVRAGLVASINKPGGNVTGISTMNFQLGTKWLGLLHELLPNANRYALLIDVAPEAELLVADVQAVAAAGGFVIDVFHADTMSAIETALTSAAQKKVGAVMIAPGPVFLDHRLETAALALQLGLPTLYTNRAFADAGGLIGYGSDFTDSFRQVGVYCGRVLKGEKPADLPVQLATKFEFVINLKTATALHIQVPPTLLALADEVIE